jgi:hypothetical protein
MKTTDSGVALARAEGVAHEKANGTLLKVHSPLGDGRSPFLRAHVARVLGKEPAMAIQVPDAVLPFSVDGFMQLFPD